MLVVIGQDWLSAKNDAGISRLASENDLVRTEIATALAERYGTNPAVAAWQIDNEYGCHDTVLSYSDAARTDRSASSKVSDGSTAKFGGTRSQRMNR